MERSIWSGETAGTTTQRTKATLAAEYEAAEAEDKAQEANEKRQRRTQHARKRRV